MNITLTLIFQMAAFILLIVFVNRVLWSPLSGMLEDRQKRISDGLAAAEKGQHEQVLAEKRAKELIQEAKSQAAEILAQAEKRAGEVVEESKSDARAEGERLISAAKSEIEQEINRVKEQLRSQVASVAVAGAEKILGKEIDSKSHDKLLGDLIARV
ncbi:MAG: F0F1 ATP synthase subunit B [Gammaproteobacteria bacterium]|nr:F0F1 ATP synthase subunit B [Gammaproteobacteria bacterium]